MFGLVYLADCTEDSNQTLNELTPEMGRQGRIGNGERSISIDVVELQNVKLKVVETLCGLYTQAFYATSPVRYNLASQGRSAASGFTLP